MAVRTRANLKTTKNLIVTTNGAGLVTGAALNGLHEDEYDSMLFPEDLTGGLDQTSGSPATGTGIKNSADADDTWKRFLWVATSNAGGHQNISGSTLMPVDSVATITLHCAGVSADGSEGYSGVLVAGFRRDGSATPVQIGSTSSLHAVDDSSGTPSVTIAMNGTDIRVTMVTSGIVVYHWTIWADVAISAV